MNLQYLRFGLIVLTAQILDVITTGLMIDRGASEANPIISAFQRELGSWWWLPKMVVAVAIITLIVRRPRPLFGMGVIATATTAPALINAAQLVFLGTASGGP